MKNNLNQYMATEFEKLNSEVEQREFVEKIRFLMMAKDKNFKNKMLEGSFCAYCN